MITQITINRKEDLPPSLIADVDEWQHRVFPEDDPDIGGIEWAGGEWLLLVWLGRTWVSAIELLERTISVGGQALRVAGVGGVMTKPEWQRCGYASMALRHAATFICEQIKAPFGLLVCGAERIPFYEAVGWQVVEGPCTFDQPDGPRTFDEHTIIMVLPCGDAPWPGGPIDLNGPPW